MVAQTGGSVLGTCILEEAVPPPLQGRGGGRGRQEERRGREGLPSSSFIESSP